MPVRIWPSELDGYGINDRVMEGQMELRYYHQEAVQSAYDYMSSKPGKNPCVVLPTGAGKTLCIAKFCTDVIGWGGRVLSWPTSRSCWSNRPRRSPSVV